jgi:TonB-dependent receptor
MSTHHELFARSRLAVAIAAVLASTSVFAQEQETTQELEEVVVTGFRGSLNTALAQKREETAAIDVIASEDIGKFPDSNLAESMQRVPGVALSRGDGGEGKNISVRGLGPTFTRVRINGMEGAAQTGSSDIYGAGNGGRSFDFNVFPTEIFSQLAVRKSMSADVEEGSLGATVDLRAPRPLDLNDDTVLTMTARGIYNSVSEDVDPRASVLFSQKFMDGTFGVLASASFQERHSREVGYSAVDILSANTNGNTARPSAGPAR